MLNKQLYDVCEMYKYQDTEYGGIKIHGQVTCRATLHTNIPYALAKFKKRIAEVDKKYPKSTFFKIVKNGESPIKIKNGKDIHTK